MGRKKPRRLHEGWSWNLHKQSRMRMKYYRRAKAQNDSEAWDSYKRLDKKIHAVQKTNKRRFKEQVADNLA